MNPIVDFFKITDTFINSCVDYFDNRIITGKFIFDIKYTFVSTINLFGQIRDDVYSGAKKSDFLFAFTAIFNIIWRILMKITIFREAILLFIQAIKIVVTCYAEIFIIFSFTFPLSIVLLNLFQTAIIAFFVGLIPILLLNIYCVSALIYFIMHKK